MAGKLVHFEIPASDADRAEGFWSGVFGWQFNRDAMPGIDYRMTRTSSEQGGAVFPSEKAGAGLSIYFDSDDIQTSIAKVRELGGDAGDRQPIPHVGWWADCKDTEGNSFGIFQSDESVQPG